MVHRKSLQASFCDAKSQHGRPIANFNKECGDTGMHLLNMLLRSTNMVANKGCSNNFRCCYLRCCCSSGTLGPLGIRGAGRASSALIFVTVAIRASCRETVTIATHMQSRAHHPLGDRTRTLPDIMVKTDWMSVSGIGDPFSRL